MAIFLALSEPASARPPSGVQKGPGKRGSLPGTFLATKIALCASGGKFPKGKHLVLHFWCAGQSACVRKPLRTDARPPTSSLPSPNPGNQPRKAVSESHRQEVEPKETPELTRRHEKTETITETLPQSTSEVPHPWAQADKPG